ncbi:MAG: hypothetical protein MZU97_19100 [Bacillus subtilis]|nr:hypothetical protein [Bacillus subtilis]
MQRALRAARESGRDYTADPRTRSNSSSAETTPTSSPDLKRRMETHRRTSRIREGAGTQAVDGGRSANDPTPTGHLSRSSPTATSSPIATG